MTVVSTPTGFLSQEECRALFTRLMGMRTGGGELDLSLVSQWVGSAKWARNRMHVVSDAHENQITVVRDVNGAQAQAGTRRIDDAGLREVIEAAEFGASYAREVLQLQHEPFVDQPILHPTLWSEATYAWDATARTKAAQAMIAPAEAAGLVAAGELRGMAQGHAVLGSRGMTRYYPVTAVECSMTVRDTKGTASGWAGINHYDVTKIDPAAIAARAFDKCQRSANPVALEPGRYTTILEPQAVCDLFTPVMSSIGRLPAEESPGPFHYASHQSKIGQRVIDPRLNLRADPMDPEAGFVPFEGSDGTPYRAVNWIEQGVLRELAYDRRYAIRTLQMDQALLNPASYTLMPAPGVSTTTLDEMIAKTDRGILVTRFSGIQMPGGASIVVTGYTRDGTWLVERGKISKAIKNFRFTESPLFALNNLEDVGMSVRVFRPGTATMAPPVRVRDFSFTSLADSV